MLKKSLSLSQSLKTLTTSKVGGDREGCVRRGAMPYRVGHRWVPVNCVCFSHVLRFEGGGICCLLMICTKYHLSKTFGVFILRKCDVKNHNEIREII